MYFINITSSSEISQSNKNMISFFDRAPSLIGFSLLPETVSYKKTRTHSHTPTIIHKIEWTWFDIDAKILNPDLHIASLLITVLYLCVTEYKPKPHLSNV